MDTCQNIYVVSIDVEEPSLASTSVQLLQDKQKLARSSSIILAHAWRYSSALTSLEENRALFDQGHPLLEPIMHHYEVFSAKTPENP